MNIITLPTVASTNTALAEMDNGLPHGTILLTHRQSAGRGQRGNSWEAEPGKNVTMSVLLRPRTISASGQFAVSEAVALAVAGFLDRYINPDRVKVKWPNDIYVDNSKIAGILIENVITGTTITRSIAGIGLNINQREFHSDAPNPVSLVQITGEELPLDTVVTTLGSLLLNLADEAESAPTLLHERYLRRLWRGSGTHLFAEPSGRQFSAEIVDVAPDGLLRLRRSPDGALCRYAFKEVAFVL